MLLQELSDFSQHDDESLSECWERFKFVVFSWSFNCELGSLLVIFCRGLNLKSCEVDFRSTDEFLDKTPEDAWDFLDELTQKLQFSELTKSSEDTNFDAREREEIESLSEDINSDAREKEPLPKNFDAREKKEIELLVINEGDMPFEESLPIVAPGYMPFEESLPIVALNNQVLSALDCATPATESTLSQEFLNVELIDFLGVDEFNLVYHPYLLDFVNALKIDLVWAIHLLEFKCLKRIRQMCYSKYLILWHGRVQFLIKSVEWSVMFIVLAFIGMINIRYPRLAAYYLELVFGKHFRDFFHDVGVNEIFLHMRNKWWAVPRINNWVDRPSLALFFNALNLEPLDFVLVTVFDATDVNVIVFIGDGIERVYPWT
ncbi:uncharacterized protein LOC131309543 [Rhododendron vialii]|uniref:uncharacterized protein LOC131309543 n=1 Tax=Rhododendron vialii TaxID=182163 RepID=UPI00265F8CD6|nr:uncharacterized protein LOC131309543 [Rhododendron vialii]